MSDQKRLSVTLLTPAVDDLTWLCTHKRLSQADVINRALQVYALIERNVAEGKKLVLQDVATEETERILLV